MCCRGRYDSVHTPSRSSESALRRLVVSQHVHVQSMFTRCVLSTRSLLLKHPNSIAHAGDDKYTLTVRLHELHRFLSTCSSVPPISEAWHFLSRSLRQRSQSSRLSTHCTERLHEHSVQTSCTQKTEAWGQTIFKHVLLITHERQNVDDICTMIYIYGRKCTT